MSSFVSAEEDFNMHNHIGDCLIEAESASKLLNFLDSSASSLDGDRDFPQTYIKTKISSDVGKYATGGMRVLAFYLDYFNIDNVIELHNKYFKIDLTEYKNKLYKAVDSVVKNGGGQGGLWIYYNADMSANMTLVIIYNKENKIIYFDVIYEVSNK